MKAIAVFLAVLIFTFIAYSITAWVVMVVWGAFALSMGWGTLGYWQVFAIVYLLGFLKSMGTNYGQR